MKILLNDDGHPSRVILEEIDCDCDNGTWPVYKSCPRDNKPQRGKPCEHCGSRTKDHRQLRTDARRTCSRCNGTHRLMETDLSYIPSDLELGFPLWQALDLRVVSNVDRPSTFNEAYLGLGYLFSVEDYGRSRVWTDAELVAHIKNDRHSTQLYHLLSKEDRKVPITAPTTEFQLVPFIAVVRRHTGYALRQPSSEEIEAYIAGTL